MPSLFPQVKEYFEQLLSRDSKLTVENGIEVAKNLIEKARTGKYVDNEENRKLGRVGMTYGQYQAHLEIKKLDRIKESSKVLDPRYQEITDKISDQFKREGFEITRVSKSATEYGKSWYLKLDEDPNGDQVRISDHSVGDRRMLGDNTVSYIDYRISDEDLDKRIKYIVGYLRAKESRRKEISEIRKLESEKEKEFLKERDLVYERLDSQGLGVSKISRTYQDIDTIRGKHPDWSNIFQKPLGGGAFTYYYTKPKDAYTSKFSLEKDYLVYLRESEIRKSIIVDFIKGDFIEKAKRAQVGEIRTRSGQKFQKMGDGSWKPVKEGKKPAKEEEGNLKQSKKGEEQPKPSKGELKVYAKNTSEASLQGAIKGSADPEIRKLAHEELVRRKKEETPQEEGKAEGKKEASKEENDSIWEPNNKDFKINASQSKEEIISNYKKISNYHQDYHNKAYKVKSREESDKIFKESMSLRRKLTKMLKEMEELGITEKDIYPQITADKSYEQPETSTQDLFKDKLKEVNGNSNFVGGQIQNDPDLDLILDKGRSFNINDKQNLKGLPDGECHWNIGKLFKDGKIDNIVIGYAKHPYNSGWHQHTWGLKDGKIVESTSSNFGDDDYYGYELTFEESEKFSEDTFKYKPGEGKIRAFKSNFQRDKVKGKNNLMEGKIQKGISEEKTPKEIADHHGVPFEQILEQLKMGVQVEYEHTDDTIESRRIALDHLMEFPDYYTRLAKMESEAKKDIEKAHKDLSKYIKRKKLVTRGGKTFLQTVYETPEGVESLDKDKAEKELEKTYDFPTLSTGEHITVKGKRKSSTGELIGLYEYKGELYLTIKEADGKSSEILVKSSKETPIIKEEGKRTAEKAFPTEIEDSKIGAVLGGSSEVRLYDEKFVLKTARDRDSGVRQLQYGQIADDVYRMMGIDTPKSKLFGDKKITEFIKGTEYGNLIPKAKAAVDKELQKGFLLDCVLANWDVIGANGDNVILEDDGKVYRIDNDGVFDLRAKGGDKDFDLGIQPTIDSMIKHNPQYKDIPKEELARQAEELYKKRELIQSRIRVENINFRDISDRVVSRIEDAYKIFGAKEETKKEFKPWEGSKGEYGSVVTNEYFKDWDSFEFEGNEGIKEAIKQKIIEIEEVRENHYKRLANRLGMKVEEFKYKIQKKLEEVISQCEFFTAQGFEEHEGSTVDKIFQSGRFKTQFDPDLKEKKVTGGSFDPEYRSETENRYFGFPEDSRIYEKRPVYGYWTGNVNGVLNSEGKIPPPNRVSQYGNVNFKIKREKVLRSATFTIEDSLGRDYRMACTPVAKPHFTSLGLAEFDTNIFERLESLKSGKLHEGADYYVESQYHGGLSLKDIESVHISKDYLYKDSGTKEYSKEEVAGSVSKLANLMIEHGAKSGNMIKLKTF